MKVWLKYRHILAAARINHLWEDLVAIVSEIREDTDISPDKYPEVFSGFAVHLEKSLIAAVETMKLDRRIPFEEFTGRFWCIAEQVEADSLGGLPGPAQCALAPIFWEQVIKVQMLLFDYVNSQFRACIRGNVASLLAEVKRQHWKTRAEKLEDLAVLVDAGMWEASRFSEEEKAWMIREAVGGPESSAGGAP